MAGDQANAGAPPTGDGGKKQQRTMRPRDAATLIIVDQSTGQPRVLMGKRRETQIFMPGKYVFPGGRVDKTDRLAPSADELRASEAEKLQLQMRGIPSIKRARALALAALRETFEEAGLVIGAPPGDASARSSIANWIEYHDTGYLPRLGVLTYFARAVTPPGRPRRYDTRFFCVDARHISHQVDKLDGELSSLDWFSLEEVQALDLPSITRVVLEDLGDRLQLGWGVEDDIPVPFYNNRNGTFRRIMLSSREAECDGDAPIA